VDERAEPRRIGLVQSRDEPAEYPAERVRVMDGVFLDRKIRNERNAECR
jgi:hypothetical protein